LLGTLCVLQFVELPSVSLCLALLFLNILLCKYNQVFYYSLWFFMGFCWTLMHCAIRLSQTIEADLEGTDVGVSGYVSSLPHPTDHYLRFNMKVSEIRDDNRRLRNNPGTIRLYWYRPYPELKPGQSLSLRVRLKRPHGYLNPGGFDYETWLFKEGIRATGYVREEYPVSQSAGLKFSIHYYRYLISRQLDKITAENFPVSGLAHALILGDRSKLKPVQNQVLAATGTSHLLAISGLHIGLIAGFAFFISRWIWPLWIPGINQLPAQHMASIVSLLAALFYALLAGFSVPTQRALVMLSLVLVNFLRYKRTKRSYLLSIALLVVLLLDPLAVLAPGFWLSFLAVSIIIFALNAEIVRTKYSKIRRWCRVQCYIYIGLVPALVLIFNQIPIISLIANLIAIPWISMVTMPLLLAGTVLLVVHSEIALIILQAGMTSLDIIWVYLEFLANWQIGPLALPEPAISTMVVAVLGITLLLMPKAMPGKYLGVLFVLPLLFPQDRSPAHGDFDVTVLDVGQGLAIVVRTQDHTLLYDSGPGYVTGFNAGSAVIVPYLKFSGVKRVDKIVQSHGDSDHIGGLHEIIDQIPINMILTSVPQQIDHISSRYCLSGQAWNWDGVGFKILHPDNNASFRGNNASCVLKIGTGEDSVLLTGDIERRAESWLLEKYPGDLGATVLVAPHHGSTSSSGLGFIQAVSADMVVFSSGYLNRFRLPNQDIIKKYRSFGAKILNTATAGAISIRFRNGEFSVVTERMLSSKFWNFRIEESSE
jgi:competence protein ComEC